MGKKTKEIKSMEAKQKNRLIESIVSFFVFVLYNFRFRFIQNKNYGRTFKVKKKKKIKTFKKKRGPKFEL